MKDLKIIITAVCLFAFQLTGFAQNDITVKGVVLDKDSVPVIGASVIVKGSTQGVPTDLDGNYTITVPSDATLEFSYIGFTTIQEKVDGRTTINVVLTEDNNYLESVVVVGYGTQKKGSVIGAVAGVGTEDILTTKSENPQNMLTGKIPGLRVWQKSAEPGTYSASFDIRGMGSPLVIIDGVPRSIEEFQRLNATDIDNVSVLKDASAAIYGVRAGNGVLLVTTKKGAEGKAKVNYSGSFTFQTPSKMPALTDVYDAMTLWNEKNLNAVTGGSIIFTEQDFEDYRSGKKLTSDWNSLIMAKMSPQTQHDLSISGGTEKIQYYLSFGYLYQEGFFKSRDLWYDKYNLRSNITAEIVRGMKLNLNISGLIDKRHTPYSSSVEIIRNYWSQGVVNPAYADKEQTMLNYAGLDLNKNTVAMMTSDVSGYKLYNQNYFQSSASLEYDFGELTPVLEGLNAKALLGFDFKYNQDEAFRKEYYLYAWDELPNSYVSQIYNGSTPNNLSKISYNQKQTLTQFILNYDRTFAEKHKVGALIGYEMQKRGGDNFYASGDLAFGTPYFTSLSGENQMVGLDKGAFYEVMYQAVIGRLNYSFSDRYLVEAQF
jgi:TonB-linked SusC/RagA family outer membrane protein